MTQSISFMPPYMLEKLCDYYEGKMKEEESEAAEQLHMLHSNEKDQKSNASSFGTSSDKVVSTMSWREKYESQKASIQLLYQQVHGIHHQVKKQCFPTFNTHTKMKVYDLIDKNKEQFSNSKREDVQTSFKHMGVVNKLFSDTLKHNVFLDCHPENTQRMFLNSQDAFNNAFWDSQAESIFVGSVDGVFFNPAWKSQDIIVHEFSHGFTQYACDLIYEKQSGALNESISDVFGAVSVQMELKQRADEADWIIGKDFLITQPTVISFGLRRMNFPGTAFTGHPALGDDPQPNHMSKFVKTKADNGGVHYNSGIPNRAFFLVATKIQGNSWEKAARIWHETVCKTKPNAQFIDFAKTTCAVAKELFGTQIEDLVNKAWDEVGIEVTQKVSPVTKPFADVKVTGAAEKQTGYSSVGVGGVPIKGYVAPPTTTVLTRVTKKRSKKVDEGDKVGIAKSNTGVAQRRFSLPRRDNSNDTAVAKNDKGITQSLRPLDRENPSCMSRIGSTIFDCFRMHAEF